MEVAAIRNVPPPRVQRAHRAQSSPAAQSELAVSCSLCEERFADVGSCLEHHRLVHGDLVYQAAAHDGDEGGDPARPAPADPYRPPGRGERFSFTV